MRQLGPGLRGITRGATATSPFQAALAFMLAWFDADYYAIDPATLRVASWIDYRNVSSLLAQSVLATQCVLPTAAAAFNSQNVALFDGTKTYVSNQAAAYWVSLSNGAGATGILTFAATSIAGVDSYFATTSTALQRGIAFYRSLGNVLASVERQALPSLINANVLGAIAVNTPTYRAASLETTAVPQWNFRNRGTVTVSGPYSNAPPDAAAPTHTLRLGSNSGPSLLARMNWAALGVANPQLTATSWGIVQTYLLGKYGIAA